jgi:hypothetical protein
MIPERQNLPSCVATDPGKAVDIIVNLLYIDEVRFGQA